MNGRTVIVLLIAGIAVIGAAIWVSSTRHLERDSNAGELVLPGFASAVNSVSEVHLVKGDGMHASLRKASAGWSVADRDYPADSGKVRKLLLDLAQLTVVEEKTRSPENYPQLGVEDVTPKSTGTRVETVTPGKTLSIIVGKPSGMKSVYVRVSGTPQSFLASPLITADADPKAWLDHTLIDIPQERVQQVTVKPADGPAYTAKRANKQQPDFSVDLPKGKELSNPTAADPIAGSLGGLSLDDVQKAPANAPAAASHASFVTFDGLQVDVTGHKDGARTLIDISASSTQKATQAEADTLNARLKGWEFEIPSYKYEGMFRPLEDLVKKPEPPASSAKKPEANGGKKAGKKTPGASPANEPPPVPPQE